MTGKRPRSIRSREPRRPRAVLPGGSRGEAAQAVRAALSPRPRGGAAHRRCDRARARRSGRGDRARTRRPHLSPARIGLRAARRRDRSRSRRLAPGAGAAASEPDRPRGGCARIRLHGLHSATVPAAGGRQPPLQRLDAAPVPAPRGAAPDFGHAPDAATGSGRAHGVRARRARLRTARRHGAARLRGGTAPPGGRRRLLARAPRRFRSGAAAPPAAGCARSRGPGAVRRHRQDVFLETAQDAAQRAPRAL